MIPGLDVEPRQNNEVLSGIISWLGVMSVVQEPVQPSTASTGGGGGDNNNVEGDLDLDLDEELEALLDAPDDQDPKEKDADPRILQQWPRFFKGHLDPPAFGPESGPTDAESLRWEKKTPKPAKGDIMWRISVVGVAAAPEDRPKERPATDADLRRTRKEFESAREYLDARLYVVKDSKGSDHQLGCHRVAMVYRVYDRRSERLTREELSAERVEKRFLFRYERLYAKNRAILEAVRHSTHHLVSRLDFRAMRDSLEKQQEDVKQYFRYRAQCSTGKSGKRRRGKPTTPKNDNKFDPVEYLPVDVSERYIYLRKKGLMDAELKYLSQASTEAAAEEEEEDMDVDVGLNDSREVIMLSSPSPSAPAAEVKGSDWADSEDEEDDEDNVVLDKPSRLNRDVLRFLERNSVCRKLGRIMEGREKSSRHDEMTKEKCYDQSLGSKLNRLVNNDFLDPDRTTDKALFDLVLDKVFSANRDLLRVAGKKGGGSKGFSSGFVRGYVFNCLVPEGIILYLREEGEDSVKDHGSKSRKRKRRGMSKEEAEKLYLTSSSSGRRRENRKLEKKKEKAKDAEGRGGKEKEEAEAEHDGSSGVPTSSASDLNGTQEVEEDKGKEVAAAKAAVEEEKHKSAK